MAGAAAIALVAVAGGLPARAADRLAFLYDGCAETRNELQAERATFEAEQQERDRAAVTAPLPAGYGTAWLASERERLRPFFQSEIAPKIARAGGSPDGAFDIWFGEMMGEVSEAKRLDLMTADYRSQRIAEAARARDEGEAALGAREATSLDACNADLRNRTVRLVSRTAAAPLKWVGLGSDGTAAPAPLPLASPAPEPEATTPAGRSVLSRAVDLLAAPLRLF